MEAKVLQLAFLMRQKNTKKKVSTDQKGKEMKNITVPIQGTDILPSQDTDTVTQIQKQKC